MNIWGINDHHSLGVSCDSQVVKICPVQFTRKQANLLITAEFDNQANGGKKYKEVVEKLSNSLIEIHVNNDRLRILDGAWFRTFGHKS